MWTADKESLCNMHDTIKYWTNDVKKKLKKAIKENNITQVEDIFPTLNVILEETRKAKKTGQKMENRLSLYSNTFTRVLGFKRVGR